MKQKYINISQKNRFDSNNPEMKLKQQNSNQTDKKHYGILIHQIARELESSHNTPIRFSDIANCDKRRQSDLFNILEALGLFSYCSDKRVVWKGFGAIITSLVRHGIQNEIRSKSETIDSMFFVGQSPSLGTLVTTFISLYIFLGVECLNIKEVANLLSQTQEQAKKILRRLYSIVFVLEQLNIIEHGVSHSEYILKEPLDLIISSIFQEIFKMNLFPEDSVEALLNRFDLVYIKNLQLGRRESYIIATKRFNV